MSTIVVTGLGLTACGDPRPGSAPHSARSVAVPAECPVKPSAENTGARTQGPASSTTSLGDGQTLSGVTVDHLVIKGANVKVRDVVVAGSILVLGDGATIDHVTARGISVSSASNVLIQHVDVGRTTGDGINVTSDRGRTSRNIVMQYNYVHDPDVSTTAHFDGTQVRGVSGLTILCSVYDAGPYKPQFNAAIYLQNANGGDDDVVIARNWLYGFGFSVMMDATNVTLRDNRIGGAVKWGTCYLGRRTGNVGLRSSGNVNETTGHPIDLCSGK